jgi:gas vesicle protein
MAGFRRVREDILSLVGLATTRDASTGLLVVGLECFVIGVLVGAGTALLLAPKSGAGLREDIRNRVRSTQQTVNEQLPDALLSRDHAPA